MSVPQVTLLDRALLGYHGIIATYLIRRGGECAIVDPGPRRDIEKFAETLLELVLDRCRITKILLTHIHLDHAGGTSTLYNILRETMKTNIKVVVHPKGAKHLENPERLWSSTLKVLGDVAYIYQEPEPLRSEAIYTPEDHEWISLNGIDTIEVIYTPGHAPHHMSFFVKDYSSTIIAGDAAGMYIKGEILPTTPPVFRYDLALKSIDKLKAFNPVRVGVAHYGFAVNGYELLSKVQQVYDCTLNIVCQFLSKKNLQFNEFYEELLLENKVIQQWKKLYETLRAPYFKHSLRNNMEGFYDYCVRFRKNF